MFKSILLPIDLNHPSSWEKALPLALEMAANGKAELHLLTIVHDLGSSLVAMQRSQTEPLPAMESIRGV